MSIKPEQGFLPLQEILDNYKPAWFDTDNWAEVWGRESEETAALIDRLSAELRERGRFDEPVTLCAESEDYDEETGETTVYPQCVGNGMHRLHAHRKTGIDPVFVAYGFEKFSEEELDNSRCLTVSFTLRAPYDSDEEFEAFDAVHELLSWRHVTATYNAWLRVGSGGGRAGEWELFFEEGMPEEGLDLELLKKDIAERIGHLAEVHGVRWHTWSEEDEENE